MKRRALLSGVGSAVVVSGCLGDGDANEATVELTETGAIPEEVEIDPGGTVTWENDLGGVGPLQEETVVSGQLVESADEWAFEATVEENGDQVSHTFEEPGAYTYYGEERGEACLCGAVLVGDASLGEPLPCSAVSEEQC